MQIEVRTSYDANRKVAGHIADGRSIERARECIGKMPGFSATDSNGKAISLWGLRGKPVVIFFLDKDCPCCVSGKLYVDRIQAAYGKNASVIGFMTGSIRAQAWIKKNRPTFRIVLDPGNKVAMTYRAEVGMACRVLDKNGKILLSYPGYSAAMLQFVGDTVAKEASIKPKKLNTFPAPEELTSGCPLIR